MSVLVPTLLLSVVVLLVRLLCLAILVYLFSNASKAKAAAAADRAPPGGLAAVTEADTAFQYIPVWSIS